MKKPKSAYSIVFSRRRTVATCAASRIEGRDDIYFLKAKGDRCACHVGYAVVNGPGVISVFTAAWKHVGNARTRAEAGQMIDSHHRKHSRAKYWAWIDKAFWCGGRITRPAKRKATK